MSMSPKERLLLKLDLAWKAANEGDMNRLRQMLILLRKSLGFKTNPLIALNALRLYRHCEQVLEEREDFAEVAQIMFNLKRAITIAKERPNTPEALAHREAVRKARAEGAPFFGARGRHYTLNPSRKRKSGNASDGAKAGPKTDSAPEGTEQD